MSKNICNKTRDITNPYEVYRSDILSSYEWRVLRKYQSPDKESKNPYARWFVAVKSHLTFGEWEYGDSYVKDILDGAKAYKASF
jgi:hypothetical protein